MGLFDRLFGPPSKDVFAREMMTALRRAGDRDDIVYDRQEFRLVRPKTRDVTNLATVYAEHCSLPRSQRKAHLQQLAQAFVSAGDELPDSFDEARKQLRPKIWTRSQFACMDLRQRLEGGPPLEIPLYLLGEHLVTSVVYDLPTSMRTLSESDFEGWNASYYEAMEAAQMNLEEATLAWARIGERLHSAVSGDNYDSSRVLLTERIRGFDVRGEPVAMVPSRDTLLITGTDDVDALRVMLDLAQQHLSQDPRPLSGIPLRLVEGEWEDWQPPADHPLRADFDWHAQMFLGRLYADQQELLNAIHEKEQTDIHVASFSAVENNDTGQKRSYCVWGEGVDAMLPQTQFIMLPTEADLTGCIVPLHAGGPWARVREVVGDLMQPVPDLYPPRWRVREFPSQQQLETIGRLEL
jgi:hypothetical protein